MVTFKTLLRLDKIKKNGEAPLVLRITKNRMHAYLYYGINTEAKYWDLEKERVKSNHPNYKLINLKIKKTNFELQELSIHLSDKERHYSAKQLKDTYQNKSRQKLIEYAAEWIEERERIGRITYGTKLRYEAVVNKLKEHVGDDFKLHQFTSEFIKSFAIYLKIKHQNKKNTVASNLSCLRAIANSLVKDKLIRVDDNPFIGYEFQFEESKRKFLYPENVQAIEKLELKNVVKLNESKSIFLFCVQTGLRIGDAMHLKFENFNGTHIHYFSQKTKAYDTLLLTNKARQIVAEQYKINADRTPFVFDFLSPSKQKNIVSALNNQKSRTALINKNLKIIAKRCKLKVNLSTHMARHTAATNFLSNGCTMEEVKAILNHNDIKTTQVYAKLRSEIKDRAIQKMNK